MIGDESKLRDLSMAELQERLMTLKAEFANRKLAGYEPMVKLLSIFVDHDYGDFDDASEAEGVTYADVRKRFSDMSDTDFSVLLFSALERVHLEDMSNTENARDGVVSTLRQMRRELGTDSDDEDENEDD
jgi:hypothetical protein